MKPEFSVIVPTFNRRALLEEVLASLVLQSDELKEIEILICDSKSTDGTAEMVSRWVEKYPDSIKHIQTRNNVSKKRNEGIKKSRHDHIIFLDDDCIPYCDFLKTYQSLAMTHLGEDCKKVLCGETRFPYPWVERSNYFRFRDSRHFGHESAVVGMPLNFKTIVTMNMCVRKSLLVAGVGGFDESFVGYGAEDQEFGWRLQQAGFSIQACDARASHHEMSRDIRAFGDKIRRTARDGMTQLLKVAPQAAQSIGPTKMLDADYPDRTIADGLVLAAFRFIMALRLDKFIAWLLIKTDGVPALYCPPAYRVYMACRYILGVGQRKRRLSADEATVGWAGKSY